MMTIVEALDLAIVGTDGTRAVMAQAQADVLRASRDDLVRGVLAERTLDAVWHVLRGRSRASDPGMDLPRMPYVVLRLAADSGDPECVERFLVLWEAAADELAGDRGDVSNQIAGEILDLPASAVKDRLMDWLAC